MIGIRANVFKRIVASRNDISFFVMSMALVFDGSLLDNLFVVKYA